MTEPDSPSSDDGKILAEIQRWHQESRPRVSSDQNSERIQLGCRVGVIGMIPAALLAIPMTFSYSPLTDGLIEYQIVVGMLIVAGATIGRIGGWSLSLLWRNAFPNATTRPEWAIIASVLLLDLHVLYWGFVLLAPRIH